MNTLSSPFEEIKEWRNNKIEQRCKRIKQWKSKNIDKIREYHRKYRANNKTKISEYSSKYRRYIREHSNEERCADLITKSNARTKQWRKNHPDIKAYQQRTTALYRYRKAFGMDDVDRRTREYRQSIYRFEIEPAILEWELVI